MHLELNLASHVKVKESFYRCISSRRKARRSVDWLLNGSEDVVSGDTEFSKVLNAFFTSVFNGKFGLQQSLVPETSGKVWSNKGIHYTHWRSIVLRNI